MKCILHVGMHKTGSSSIQSALATYDDGKNFYAQLGRVNHSLPIYTAFSDDYLNYHIWEKKGLTEDKITALRNDFISALDKQLSTDSKEVIIISGEDISLLSRDNVTDLITFLRNYCDEIKAIAYVRHPMDFAASLFQQKIKGGIKEIPKMISPMYRFRIEKFIQAIGKENVIIKNYSREQLVGGDVVKDFCATFDLDINITIPSRKNESISSDAIKCLFLFNRTNPLYFGDDSLARIRKEFIKVLTHIFDDKTKMDKRLFQDLSDYSDCSWLYEEFDIDFMQEKSSSNMDQTLDNWINAFPRQTIKQLKEFLTINNINNHFDNVPEKLINRVYYLIIEGRRICSDNIKLIPNNLSDEDADILRDVAMKYENGHPVSKKEALRLMKFARMARPHSPFIQKKIVDWSDE